MDDGHCNGNNEIETKHAKSVKYQSRVTGRANVVKHGHPLTLAHPAGVHATLPTLAYHLPGHALGNTAQIVESEPGGLSSLQPWHGSPS